MQTTAASSSQAGPRCSAAVPSTCFTCSSSTATADRHRAGDGTVRTPAQQRRRERIQTLVDAALPADTLARLRAEGDQDTRSAAVVSRDAGGGA